MANARRAVATIVTLTGVAIAAAAGAFCAYQLYPAEMNDWELRHLGAGVTIGLLVWVIIAFPFAWLGDRIDPSPKSQKE
jgi:threonine/homoserine efflux transporter RhtA